MRVINCIIYDHNPGFVLLAAVICTIGAIVIVHLFRQAARAVGMARAGWLFLTAVCAGSSIWATHFIAMLGYEAQAHVHFDAMLTMVSILIAILGTGIGFAVATSAPNQIVRASGGALVGLSVAAMHYTGMFAYRVEGIVHWDQTYVIASLLLAVAFGSATTLLINLWKEGWQRHIPTATLVLTIVSLHFTGMSAFQVTPLGGDIAGLNAQAFGAMAASVMVAALIIIGTGVSSYVIDDRTRASSVEQLRKMAFQDPLTGLPNRRAFQKHVEGLIGDNRPYALVLLDIDHFKSINDTHGHAIGDMVLIEAAKRIRADLSGTEFFARLGGDEFAVACADGVGLDVKERARLILACFSDAFKMGERQLHVSSSMGVAVGGEGQTLDDVLSNADLALYEAKRAGRHQFVCHTAELARDVLDRRQMEHDLDVALNDDQFHLVYQPLVDLKTKQTIGYEALLRWTHPERGVVSPDVFIPVAEDCGKIVQIGAWVLQQACRDAATWSSDLYVSVNVSAVQLREVSFLALLTSALKEAKILPKQLQLELTETAMVLDGSRVANMLRDIRALGVAIAMDDFGTGYSSLAHLRDLPIDRIKIDQSFIQSADDDVHAMAVLKAITQIGADLGLPTLAEGVETSTQEHMLRSLGCDAVQGYLYGRPERKPVIDGCDKKLLDKTGS